MIKKIKRILLNIFIIKRLFKKDKQRKFSLALNKKIYAWVRGFLPESVVIYNFPQNDYKKYISDYQRLKAVSINGTNSVLLDYKHLFSHVFFNEKRVFQPDYFVLRGKVFSFNDGKPIREEELLEDLNGGEYVFKPTGGGGGAGILFGDFKTIPWKINGKPYAEAEFRKLIKTLSNVLIYKRIYQTGFANEVNSGSLNTIRMLTMIDPKTDEAFLAFSVFRCGVKGSGFVDNWSGGGLCSKVEIETGKMGKAITFPKKNSLEWVSYHPESKFPIENTIIPQWEMIKSEVLSLAQRYSFIPYIAWDIVPMATGFLILEANSNSDVNLLQVHEPLLSSPKVAAFYKHYRVI